MHFILKLQKSLYPDFKFSTKPMQHFPPHLPHYGYLGNRNSSNLSQITTDKFAFATLITFYLFKCKMYRYYLKKCSI